jgi:hypothetical protein
MPPPGIPPNLEVRSRVKRPVPDKAIFWPTAAGYGDAPHVNADATRFPDLVPIKARRATSRPEPLTAFTQAAGNAQDRVLVLDDYIFKARDNEPLQQRIDHVLEWLPYRLVANDVRILTSSIGDEAVERDIAEQFSQRAVEIQGADQYRSGRIIIRVKFTLQTDFPYVHDRFAIVDDELWHFGATVGGFHELVNAATRGWDIDDHGALQFFDLAWRGDSDFAQHGGRPRCRP